MADSDIAEEVDIEEIGTGGGKVKRAVAALGVLAVLFVVLKLRGRGGSSEEETGSSVERVDDEAESDRIDTVSTKDADEESDDSGLEVKTTSGSSGVGGRFDDLDLVDYLAIFAAALQSARDEYRIRTER